MNNNTLHQLLNDNNDQIRSIATEIVKLQQAVDTNQISKDEYQELIENLMQSKVINQLNDTITDKIIFQRSVNLLKKAASLL